MKYILLLGRILFSLIFLMATPGHFSQTEWGYAASKGTPAANILVPIAGIISLLGAISIILGYKAKIGAWLVIIFLIPVTLIIHSFWKVQDAMQAQLDMVMFLKNISMIGSALFIAYFGSGPLSLDNVKKNQAP
jgi:putative oxidoreductase